MNDLKSVSYRTPSRVRYSILAMLCGLAMITYMDRAVYGSAKEDIAKAAGAEPADAFKLVLFFQIAYALFEIPTGYMGDRFGPRITLLRIVLWWSTFIALTACAGLAVPGGEWVPIGFTVLVILQFFFGMGEAGAFPNITKSLYNWFPLAQRGSAQGTIWLSARFMGGMTPVLWLILTNNFGLDWRQTLWLFSAIAVIWCVVFYLWFTNHPEEHSSTNGAERDLINTGRSSDGGHDGVPWGKFLRSWNLRFICMAYMVTNFNWYFLLYNLPKLLKERSPQLMNSDLGRVQLGLMGGSPLLIGMLGCLMGGVLTDRYVRRTGDKKWGRRLFGMFGYGMAGVCYLMASFFTGAGYFWYLATFAMMVGFFNDMIMGPAWATCQDVGGKYAAIVAGCMNMIGNLGAALGILVTGTILKNFDGPTGYIYCFSIYACLYGVGALLWLFIDASKPILDENPPLRPRETID